MTLYHFCADRHVKNIIRQGLIHGGVCEPTKTGYIIHRGWMWLTTDPDPKRQSWATRKSIPYSRTAWRLTIEIPDEEIRNIYDHKTLPQLWPATVCLFRGWAGSENWRVYRGMIPKQWIKAAERMEGQA